MVFIENKLCFYDSDKWRNPFYVDFTSIKTKRHHTKEALIKAVGASQGLTVIDATAGFATDGFLLAAHGCEITLLERDPNIRALLQDGLYRGLQDISIQHIIRKMYLIPKAAEEYIPNIEPKDYPDVIYFDPMFENKFGRKAQVNKKAQVLRHICGSQNDISNIVFRSLDTAKKRVVVKSPLGARSLLARKPDWQIKAKKIKFDVYVTRATS